MLTFSRFFILFENFETVSKLFLDPQHKDKDWQDLKKEFESTGGKFLGAGSYGSVYTHPKWPYVVKMFPKDDPYLSFARFAYKNPHKSFPKLYGPPTRITPEFSRERRMGQVYLSRLERLNPISTEEFNEIEKYSYPYHQYLYMTQRPEIAKRFHGNQYNLKLAEVKDTLHDMPENIRSVLQARDIIENASRDGNWGALDWKPNNIMKRDNGDFVVIDPVWEGWTAQEEERRRRREEEDFNNFDNLLAQGMAGEDDNYKPPLLRGGVKPKNVIPRKRKKSILNIPKDEDLKSWGSEF